MVHPIDLGLALVDTVYVIAEIGEKATSPQVYIARTDHYNPHGIQIAKNTRK